MKKEIVALAMSGGVDSSVAACLLLEQGYEVLGITMKLLDDEKTNQAINDAKKVCGLIGIKHFTFDLRKEFKEIVIKNFIDSYQTGKTPNPCVVCNKFFKFGLFYDKAKQLGATKMATGHYAIIKNNKLIKSEVEHKDQSYFLYGIKKEILPHIIFPLAEYHTKEEIRQIARNYHLPISEKKDSQEICFVPNDDYKSYLKNNNYIQEKAGNIRLEDGKLLGKHNGLTNYTIGQRKGLNIAYKEPLYVLKIDNIKNEITVGPNSQLYHQQLIANSINQLESWETTPIFAKVRSRGIPEEVTITSLEENKLLVTFKKEQRAITPGQSIVFYNNENVCLGGGIIEEVK